MLGGIFCWRKNWFGSNSNLTEYICWLRLPVMIMFPSLVVFTWNFVNREEHSSSLSFPIEIMEPVFRLFSM